LITWKPSPESVGLQLAADVRLETDVERSESSAVRSSTRRPQSRAITANAVESDLILILTRGTRSCSVEGRADSRRKVVHVVN
jgi:hypothetical protein